jgi:hypothetical protein
MYRLWSESPADAEQEHIAIVIFEGQDVLPTQCSFPVLAEIIDEIKAAEKRKTVIIAKGIRASRTRVCGEVRTDRERSRELFGKVALQSRESEHTVALAAVADG